MRRCAFSPAITAQVLIAKVLTSQITPFSVRIDIAPLVICGLLSIKLKLLRRRVFAFASGNMQSRVLATIGVTRGFGDHNLKAQSSSVDIKPFLTPEPEAS